MKVRSLRKAAFLALHLPVELRWHDADGCVEFHLPDGERTDLLMRKLAKGASVEPFEYLRSYFSLRNKTIGLRAASNG